MATVAGQAVQSQGTLLKKGTASIALITSIGGLQLKADTIDVTTLDSADGFKTFVGGLRDAGEISIGGFFNATDHQPLLTDLESGSVNAYTIEFSDGSKWDLNGIVVGFSSKADKGSVVSFDASIKVSGKPTLTAGI